MTTDELQFAALIMGAVLAPFVVLLVIWGTRR